MTPKDVFNKALLLEEENGKEMKLSFTTPAKAKSFRAMLYKEKRLNNDESIFISIKNNILTLTKNKENFDFSIEIIENIEISNENKNNSKITQTNLDEKRVKTIREKLSIFDKEKEVLIEQFRNCKVEIESQDDISEEDKQFLIRRSLEIVNNEIEKLNVKAREIAQEARKVKD